jgi:rhamnose utilization protein RhaD (predicted bifunctional aldolase and dehydrogenase)
MVLVSHGIFSFGAEAKESYERMIELVSMAEEYLQKKKAWHLGFRSSPPLPQNAKRSRASGARSRSRPVFPVI